MARNSPAHRLGRDDDVERLKHLLAEVDKPPTHHAMNRRDRAILHHASQGCAVLARQARRLDSRALPAMSPEGPWALNFITQSRTI